MYIIIILTCSFIFVLFVLSLYIAYDNDQDAILQLITRGVSVNVSDYDGRRALHIAASENHITLVKYLLKAGAEITTAIDRFGSTPITDAKRNSHNEIVQILTNHKQNQHLTKTDSKSPWSSKNSTFHAINSTESINNPENEHLGETVNETLYRALSSLTVTMEGIGDKEDEEGIFDRTLLLNVLNRCGLLEDDHRIAMLIEALPAPPISLTLTDMELIR